MAVLQTFQLQAASGRFGDLLERSQKLQRVRERLAPECKTRRFTFVSGGSSAGPTLIVSVEFKDMKAFGEYADRMEADPEARALRESFRSARDPIVLSQTTSLLREL